MMERLTLTAKRTTVREQCPLTASLASKRKEGSGPSQVLRLSTRRQHGLPLHFSAYLSAGASCTARRCSTGRRRRRRHGEVTRLQACEFFGIQVGGSDAAELGAPPFAAILPLVARAGRCAGG